jgi:hypothetical protein
MSQTRHQSVADVEKDEVLLKEIVLEEISIRKAGKDHKLPYTPEVDNDGDWMLHSYDKTTTESGTAHEEFRRLQVMRTYLRGMDGGCDEALDRLVRTTAKTFRTFGSWTCLMDIRRIKYISAHGFGDLETLPRVDCDPCPHVIRYQAAPVFVVEDLSQNEYFKDLSLVLNPPYLRFYAAVPLMSPEGYRIGTFGVTHSEPRPGGLSNVEKQALLDLASVAMDIILHRRFVLQMTEKSKHAVTCISPEVNSPLHSLQTSLAWLKQEAQSETNPMTESQKDSLETAEYCVAEITKVAMGEVGAGGAGAGVMEVAMGEVTENGDAVMNAATNAVTKRTAEKDMNVSVHIRELFDRASQTVNDMPKKVPLVTCVDSQVPTHIVCDDVRVFQISVTFLSMAVSEAEHGVVLMRVTQTIDQQLSVALSNPSSAHDQHRCSWDPSSPLLASMASLVASLDGKFGYRSARDVTKAAVQNNSEEPIIWFTMPIVLPTGRKRLNSLRAVKMDTDTETETSSLPHSAVGDSSEGSD